MKEMAFSILLVLTGMFSCQQQGQDQQSPPSKVTVKKEGDGFSLYRNEQAFFIKGARTLGTRFMDKVAEYGGNTIRIGFPENIREVLDEAHRAGLTVLVGLPVQPERNGFNYSDPAAVANQFNRMKEIVQEYRNHPAVLMWAIGNELDHIPGDKDYDLKMWDAVNEIALMIHEEDPFHPAMTVIGTGRKEKLGDLMERCPDLDLLGVNAYADIWDIPEWLRQYNWNKPYAVTEWGPSGHWQVPRTEWGAVIEETSTEKGNVYRERYEDVIRDDPWCVGSYVFLWTSNRQERTHTWYNMFHDDGAEKAAVQVMAYEWTGTWPENLAPVIDSLKIDGKDALDHIDLEVGTQHAAQLFVHDPEGDPLRISWELIPENREFGAYAGQGEKKPPAVDGAVIAEEEGGRKITFTVPDDQGRNYRLFVYAHDKKGHVAVANIPFHVQQH